MAWLHRAIGAIGAALALVAPFGLAPPHGVTSKVGAVTGVVLLLATEVRKALGIKAESGSSSDNIGNP